MCKDDLVVPRLFSALSSETHWRRTVTNFRYTKPAVGFSIEQYSKNENNNCFYVFICGKHKIAKPPAYKVSKTPMGTNVLGEAGELEKGCLAIPLTRENPRFPMER